MFILFVIMKLELFLQLEIAIKAQLNKKYGYMIMKEIYVFFLKNILYHLHCAVIATHLSKRARKKPPGLVFWLSTSSHTDFRLL